MTFADKLRKFLKEKGLTQRELSKLAGCTECAVSRFVHGDRLPQIKLFYRIAKALNKPMEDFFDDI